MPNQFDRIISVTGAHSMNIYVGLGTTCNFNCAYCPPHVHDGASPWHDIDQLMAVLTEIRRRYAWKHNRVYNLLGGEPTNWAKLPELCRRIKAMDDHSSIMIATNGSRTPRYWRDIAPYLDRCIVSVHVAQIDITKLNLGFRECILGGMRLSTNILMDIDHWHKAVSDAEWMIEHGWSHLITMKPVETLLGSNQLQPYTDQQLSVMANWDTSKQLSRRDACKALAKPRPRPPDDLYRFGSADGSVTDMNNFQAVSLGHDRMQGWHCWLNADKITVSTDGKVKPGDTCDQWPEFGNFLTSDPSSWDWRIYPQQCHRDRCVCGGDLDTHKFADAAASQAYGDVIAARGANK